MIGKRAEFGLLLALAFVTPPAFAHKPSDSYLSLEVIGRTIVGQWDIALRDLDFVFGVDGNDDGRITWGELRSRHKTIEAYALSRLTLRIGESECVSHAREHLVNRHSDGGYAVLRFKADCPGPVSSLEIAYSLFFDLDPQHKGLVRAHVLRTTQTAILSVDRPVQHLDFATPSPWRQFYDYLREGVWHIWIGIDHVLFLVTLLLPTVLYRRSGRWQVVDGVRSVVLDVVKIVTAFTLAHTLTLSLSVTGLIALPSRLTEAAIAMTVVIAALNNLYPIVTRRIWLVAFGFGLIHGLGFANVLMGLGLPDGAMLRSLLAFNLGVEIGQLAIVMTLLPLGYLLRTGRLYQPIVVTLGSAVIAAIGFAWFLERAFNVSPLLS